MLKMRSSEGSTSQAGAVAGIALGCQGEDQNLRIPVARPIVSGILDNFSCFSLV